MARENLCKFVSGIKMPDYSKCIILLRFLHSVYLSECLYNNIIMGTFVPRLLQNQSRFFGIFTKDRKNEYFFIHTVKHLYNGPAIKPYNEKCK